MSLHFDVHELVPEGFEHRVDQLDQPVITVFGPILWPIFGPILVTAFSFVLRIRPRPELGLGFRSKLHLHLTPAFSVRPFSVRPFPSAGWLMAKKKRACGPLVV